MYNEIYFTVEILSSICASQFLQQLVSAFIYELMDFKLSLHRDVLTLADC